MDFSYAPSNPAVEVVRRSHDGYIFLGNSDEVCNASWRVLAVRERAAFTKSMD